MSNIIADITNESFVIFSINPLAGRSSWNLPWSRGRQSNVIERLNSIMFGNRTKSNPNFSVSTITEPISNLILRLVRFCSILVDVVRFCSMYSICLFLTLPRNHASRVSAFIDFNKYYIYTGYSEQGQNYSKSNLRGWSNWRRFHNYEFGNRIPNFRKIFSEYDFVRLPNIIEHNRLNVFDYFRLPTPGK